MTYRAPVGDLLRTMRFAASRFHNPETELDANTAEILEGAATVAESALLPLDRRGDQDGVTLVDGQVHTVSGWRDAYRTWIDGGWNGLAAPERAGGMGLSLLTHFACAEIWSGANLSFALVPLLTSGAIEAIGHHASADLQALFLPKLVSGEWTGTMNLTEPQAGSDLSALTTRAVRRGDGTYAITGQKIFISYGDHDLTDNIVHLVLARLPDAPPGTRGISLFLVPKILVAADGALGAPNDLRPIGIERKLGMHAAPTCTMMFGDQGGAVGYLVGEENRGLACMFTMMNNARLAVGIEGVAAAERATQTAVAYARDRRQGRGDSGASPVAIIEHPDVARMLMTMQASTAAARAICYLTAAALDAARDESDPRARAVAANRAALLTPVAKAFATDVANEVASLGVQVHGGLGYVEATGAAQILRDARIFAIYEGTNGIQAIDLATRKLTLDDGGTLAHEIADMRAAVDDVHTSNLSGFGRTAPELADAVDALERASRSLAAKLKTAPAAALAVASPYLRLFGLARGAAALASLAVADHGAKDAARPRSIATARFFAENLLPAAAGLERVVAQGGDALGEQRGTWLDALAEPA